MYVKFLLPTLLFVILAGTAVFGIWFTHRETPEQFASRAVIYIRANDANDHQLFGGSGFALDSTTILTNYHVISDTDVKQIEIETIDGTIFPATIVGFSKPFDIAVLHIPANKVIVPIQMGDSDQLKVGDKIITAGAPNDNNDTVGTGVLSRINVGLSGVTTPLMQTTSLVFSGSSGGMALNDNGKVVGMTNAIDPELSGVGYFIPSNVVLKMAQRIINHQSVDIPTLRFALKQVYQTDTDGVKTVSGSEIIAIDPTTPYSGMLQKGDIVHKIDNSIIRSNDDFVIAFSKYLIGDLASITLERNKKFYLVSAILTDTNPTVTTIEVPSDK